mmetsp:Transcript_38364/g.114897  ORF Transcript_38364/g.114897 Transcript_38364/m.114897 type:complete len:239 (+) Transcript_38364:112-828(+)
MGHLRNQVSLLGEMWFLCSTVLFLGGFLNRMYILCEPRLVKLFWLLFLCETCLVEFVPSLALLDNAGILSQGYFIYPFLLNITSATMHFFSLLLPDPTLFCLLLASDTNFFGNVCMLTHVCLGCFFFFGEASSPIFYLLICDVFFSCPKCFICLFLLLYEASLFSILFEVNLLSKVFFLCAFRHGKECVIGRSLFHYADFIFSFPLRAQTSLLCLWGQHNSAQILLFRSLLGKFLLLR